MAKFLTPQEVYRVIQRELPEVAYPDGAPSAYFSTADSYAAATAIASLYANLSIIYDNYWPQHSTDRIDDWVFKVFGYYLDTLTLEEKRQKVVDKIRKIPSISLWEVLKTVAQFVPEGTYVQVAEYGCGAAGGWKLGVSRLGTETYLNFNHTFAQLNINAEDWCSFVASRKWRLGRHGLGLDTYLSQYTHNQIFYPQANAYGYEIRIFDYTLPPDQLAQLNIEVRRTEPARSFHIFKQNQSLAAYGLVKTVNNVDQFSGVTCIAVDTTQTTGFIGKTTVNS